MPNRGREVCGIDRSETDLLQVLRQLLDGERLTDDLERYVSILWQASPEIHALLSRAPDLEQARDALYRHIERRERQILSLESDLPGLKQATIRESVRAIRSIIAPCNEEIVEFSALEHVWLLARDERELLPQPVHPGFVMELIYLFRGLEGHSNIYDVVEDVLGELPDFLQLAGREAAHRRMEILDAMAGAMDRYLDRYPSGLDREVIQRREVNRDRILTVLHEPDAPWDDHRWHLAHVIKQPEILSRVLDLSDEELAGTRRAVEHHVPFGITPFYLSLMDQQRDLGFDEAIRAQVIPPADYVDQLMAHRGERRAVFDFMGELDTSPVDLITRRYPRIAILKPYNTCSQICVYCQRNWEIDQCMAPDAMAPQGQIDRAINWLKQHPAVNEVLVTGGDPMVMSDDAIRHLLDRLAALAHVRRIRIGTRTPVVLPQRWTDELADLLGSYRDPGRREICVVTHFEHPYEVTPEATQAVERIRMRGINVYNQQVFSVWNSRRFESAKLRIVLRSIGVDPYYTFNMKGKEETERYIAPIARLLQERKEEVRLLPGLDRTDEPVFNVPRLGKNHLRLWQDHRILSIRPDGRRIYSFHPWEKNLTLVPPYHYTDVSIHDYLQGLAARGEDLQEYRTIWYYY